MSDHIFNEPRLALNRIYTRMGDAGETRLVGGQRVAKDDVRIACYGTVDELNAFVGVARVTAEELSAGAEPLRGFGAILKRVQHELFNLGSILATLPEDVHPKQPRVTDADIEQLEREIDAANEELAPLRSFVLPGGSRLDAELHVCRTVCRRAERLLVGLAREHSVPGEALRYLNRLSDAFFVWSRWVNHALGRAGSALGAECGSERRGGSALMQRQREVGGGHWPALIASFLGWTLDAFDFFLVTFCLTAIGKEFHQPDKAIAFSLLLTLAFRPVGAFLFGLLADRYGRRLPLMIDLIFYSVVEVATGFAPSFKIFLLLRALFGIGMGGEWGVGASLAMEKVPAKWRGVLSGFLQEGYALGNLLAALCYWFLFDRWGWRPLFFLGGLPALLAFFVRFRVKESEVWEKSKQESWADLGGAIAKHWKLFLYLVLLMTGMNLASHGTQDMYPTFLQRFWKFGTAERSAISAISMAGAIFGGVLIGLFSDRIGRRRAIVFSLLAAILTIPLWAYAPQLGLLVTGAFLMQFFVQGAWGVIPAHLSELSPNQIRGFMPGFAYQCGVLLAGSVGLLEAIFAERMSYATAMAATGGTVFAATAIIAALGREKKGIEFSAEKNLRAPLTSGDPNP